MNHEEVIKALEEGISFIEDLNPDEAVVNENNHVVAVRFKAKDRTVELPARSVMVAAGTTPNITYEKEHTGTFRLDKNKKFFESHRVRRNDGGSFVLEPETAAKPLSRPHLPSGSSNTALTITPILRRPTPVGLSTVSRDTRCGRRIA